MTTYLDRILAAHRAAASADRRDVDELRVAALAAAPARGFAGAVAAEAGAGRLGVIAEVKRRSPSKGDLAAGLDPAWLARTYAAGGACCLSVLTDHDFFGGSADDLHDARSAVDVPVLRKDFTIAAVDVYEARLMGADAVLLIVAALSDDELATLHSLALSVGLDALVEVHDSVELSRALDIGAALIGVNQRDLVTFEVDPLRAGQLIEMIPPEVLAVAESGIRGADDAARLAAAGYQAVLVGESLVTAANPSSAVASLRVPIGVRR